MKFPVYLQVKSMWWDQERSVEKLNPIMTTSSKGVTITNLEIVGWKHRLMFLGEEHVAALHKI